MDSSSNGTTLLSPPMKMRTDGFGGMAHPLAARSVPHVGKALVIDDVRALLAESLALMGYSVLAASSGVAGLELMANVLSRPFSVETLAEAIDKALAAHSLSCVT